MDIVIMVGTHGGTAELVADELQAELGQLGHKVEIVRMGHEETVRLSDAGLFLFVTSSHGEGELPEKARPFYDRLAAERPDLSDVRYGVFGLGDNKRHAHTFCFGAIKLDALLANLGAERVGAIECHDMWSKSHADDHAIEWVADWLEAAAAQ